MSRARLGELGLCSSRPEATADRSSKLLSEIDELAGQGLALPPDVYGQLAELAVSVSDAVDLAVQVSQLTTLLSVDYDIAS